MPDMPLALTADAEFGENDYQAFSIGAKFYFGAEQKSLINRHRQDDPDDGLFDFIGGASGAASVPGGGGPVAEGILDDGIGEGVCDSMICG